MNTKYRLRSEIWPLNIISEFYVVSPLIISSPAIFKVWWFISTTKKTEQSSVCNLIYSCTKKKDCSYLTTENLFSLTNYTITTTNYNHNILFTLSSFKYLAKLEKKTKSKINIKSVFFISSFCELLIYSKLFLLINTGKVLYFLLMIEISILSLI